MSWSSWGFDPAPDPQDLNNGRIREGRGFGGKHPTISAKQCVGRFLRADLKPWDRGPTCMHCKNPSEEHHGRP